MQSPKQEKAEKPNLEKPKGKRGGAMPNSGGARAGAGRPAFVPTDKERQQAEVLSGYGLPLEHICVLIRDGINIDTLRAHFKKELVSGKAKANSMVGKTLYQKATGGDTTAMIWWSKTQMKWKESLEVDHTSSDGSMTPKASGMEAVYSLLERAAKNKE
jgi:hypothetical protein